MKTTLFILLFSIFPLFGNTFDFISTKNGFLINSINNVDIPETTELTAQNGWMTGIGLGMLKQDFVMLDIDLAFMDREIEVKTKGFNYLHQSLENYNSIMIAPSARFFYEVDAMNFYAGIGPKIDIFISDSDDNINFGGITKIGASYNYKIIYIFAELNYLFDFDKFEMSDNIEFRTNTFAINFGIALSMDISLKNLI
jgi:hypothetical protein